MTTKHTLPNVSAMSDKELRLEWRSTYMGMWNAGCAMPPRIVPQEIRDLFSAISTEQKRRGL